ncbi:hypothetical protein JOJ88_006071 [Pantoea cypripedii]|nr:hypothetical protein [Pantoea cypripedii]
MMPGALGLVTNAVVLWNTLYMQGALSHLRIMGETPEDEHIARLSPLMHGHINMLGHYAFTLPEDILKGVCIPVSRERRFWSGENTDSGGMNVDSGC